MAAMEPTGGADRSGGVGFSLHSYSEWRVLIVRGAQMQNVTEDVQIVQKQRTPWMNANNHIADARPSLFSVQLLIKFSVYRTRRIVKFRS
jgi:hypothetical protein